MYTDRALLAVLAAPKAAAAQVQDSGGGGNHKRCNNCHNKADSLLTEPGIWRLQVS